ncbi:hypothetical protein [Streptomyces sp. NPDC048551]|uniref:hypothetical protein n=1 Tax=Streptomyces sp. NPDC048551 TaxID=3155758 RepID=UPI00341EFACB
MDEFHRRGKSGGNVKGQGKGCKGTANGTGKGTANGNGKGTGKGTGTDPAAPSARRHMPVNDICWSHD